MPSARGGWELAELEEVGGRQLGGMSTVCGGDRVRRQCGPAQQRAQASGCEKQEALRCQSLFSAWQVYPGLRDDPWAVLPAWKSQALSLILRGKEPVDTFKPSSVSRKPMHVSVCLSLKGE